MTASTGQCARFMMNPTPLGVSCRGLGVIILLDAERASNRRDSSSWVALALGSAGRTIRNMHRTLDEVVVMLLGRVFSAV